MADGSITEREAFLAMSPPRMVPATIRELAVPWKDTLTQTMGSVILLLIGMGLSWLILPKHPLRDWQLRQGPTQHVTGTILSVKPTKTTINGSQLIDYDFSYPVDGSRKAGSVSLTRKAWRTGDSIEVRYLKDEPELAAVAGTGWGSQSPWSLLVLIVPTLGIFSLCMVFRERLGKLRLLRRGWLGSATVTSVEEIRDRNQRQFWYKTTLVLTDDGRSISRRGRSEQELGLLQRKRETGEAATILYDPQQPKRMLFPESWGGSFPVLPISFTKRPGNEKAAGEPVRALSREMEEFLALPSPRTVPRSIAKKYSVSAGLWPMMIFGAVFMSFGLFIAWSAILKERSGALPALVFPLVGAALLLGPIYFTRRWKSLLRDGVLGEATITSVESTSVQINNRPQFKIHLVDQDDGTALTKRTCDAREIEFAGRRMEAGEPVTILYDRRNPKHFLLPEAADG